MATIRKRPTGWQAQIRKRGNPPISRTFRTKSMAEDWARKKEDEIARGVYVSTGTAERMTLSVALQRYLETITPRKKSAAKEASRIRILEKSMGRRTLAALSAQEIVDFVDERLESVVADTCRKELNTLIVVVDAAMALWGVHLPANPARTAGHIIKVTKTLTPGVQRERRLAQGEEDALIAAVSGEMRVIIPFAAETAMRRGEIAAMRREHRTGSLLHIPETKTGRPRTIPLSRTAAELLDSLPARIDGYVFGMQPDSISRAFSRACTRAGITDLRFHDLRHEGTSRLFEAGLSIHEVALITGHGDWKSLQRYTQLRPENIGAKLSQAG